MKNTKIQIFIALLFMVIGIAAILGIVSGLVFI